MKEGLQALGEWQLESALLNFDGVLQIDPEFWPAGYYRAICLKKQARLREAKNAFISLRQSTPSGEISIELGEIYVIDMQFDKARKCFEEAVENTTTSAKGLVALGSLLAIQGKTNKAVESFEAAIKANPKSPEGYMSLALVKIEKASKVNGQSLELFDQVLSLDSTYKPAIFWRGLVHLELDHHELAVADFNRLITQSPGNPLFHGIRGIILESLGRYDDAFPDLVKAVRRPQIYSGKYYLDQLNEAFDISQASTYFQRSVYGLKEPSLSTAKKGFCQLVVGKNKDALKTFDQAISMSPIASLYLLRGVLYDKDSIPALAQANYKMALKLDNDIYFAHLKRSMHFFNIGRNDSAFYETKEMKRIDPENELTYQISGYVKWTLGDNAGCASDLTRNLSYDSSNLYLLKLRAQCRLRNNEYKGAYKDLLKYKSEAPEDVSIDEMLLQSALAAGDTVYVVRFLQPLSKKAPNNCELQLALAGHLISLKDYEQATNLTTTVMRKLDNGSCDNAMVFVFILKARALYTLGLIHDKKGDFNNALARFTEAFQYQQDADILLARCIMLIKLNRIAAAKKDLAVLQNANYGPAQPYIRQYLNP